jgi:hypothetical protein
VPMFFCLPSFALSDAPPSAPFFKKNFYICPHGLTFFLALISF